MGRNAAHLTIRHAQVNQPWTVPYREGVQIAAGGLVPHILANHCVLHAAKSVGKLATVFEGTDHQPGSANPPTLTIDQLKIVKAMSADLMTAALRFANLYSFDLATELADRVEEKNGVPLAPWKDIA